MEEGATFLDARKRLLHHTDLFERARTDTLAAWEKLSETDRSILIRFELEEAQPDLLIQPGTNADTPIQQIHAAASRALPRLVAVSQNLATCADHRALQVLQVNIKPVASSAAKLCRWKALLEGYSESTEASRSKSSACHLTDVARVSVVCDSVRSLAKLVNLLLNGPPKKRSSWMEPRTKKRDPCEHGFQWKVVQLRNRFLSPNAHGYRDLLVTVSIELESGDAHLCEMQVHLKSFHDLNSGSNLHQTYKYFADYLKVVPVDERHIRVQMLLDLNQIRTYQEELQGTAMVSLLESCVRGQIQHLKAALHLATGMRMSPTAAKISMQLAELTEQQHGPESEQYTKALTNVTMWLHQTDHKRLAIFHRESLKIARKVSPSLTIAQCLENLALILQERCEHENAIAIYKSALCMKQELLGKDHPCLAQTMHSMAASLEGHTDQHQLCALEMHQRATELTKHAYGEGHPTYSRSLAFLALSLAVQGKWQHSARTIAACVAQLEKQGSSSIPETLVNLNRSYRLMRSTGRGNEVMAARLRIRKWEGTSLEHGRSQLDLSLSHFYHLEPRRPKTIVSCWDFPQDANTAKSRILSPELDQKREWNVERILEQESKGGGILQAIPTTPGIAIGG